MEVIVGLSLVKNSPIVVPRRLLVRGYDTSSPKTVKHMSGMSHVAVSRRERVYALVVP